MNIKELLTREDRTNIERWCEGRCKSLYLGDGRVLSRVLGYYLMHLPARDCSLTPHLAMDGYWEMWITMAVARHVQPGWRCIDVGANVGYYTLLLADLVGPAGAVQAWEVQRELANCVERSVRANGFTERVRVVHAAASNEEGIVNCVPQAQDWELGSVAIEKVDLSESGRSEASEADGVCMRLDSQLVCDWDTVDFVKIDVEGHEPEVWEGMKGILERSPRIQVLMEFTPSQYADPAAFLNQIRSDGFQLQKVDFHGDVRPTGPQELIDCPSMDMLWLSR